MFEFLTPEEKLQREEERKQRRRGNKGVTANGRKEELVPFLLAPCPQVKAARTLDVCLLLHLDLKQRLAVRIASASQGF